jgi:hypothetical protein
LLTASCSPKFFVAFELAEVVVTVQNSEKFKCEPSDEDAHDQADGAAFEQVLNRFK